MELTGTNRPCGLTTDYSRALSNGDIAISGARTRPNSHLSLDLSLRKIPCIQLSIFKSPALVNPGSRMVSGRHSEGETPVPIPNTAVKPFSADGTVSDGVMGE